MTTGRGVASRIKGQPAIHRSLQLVVRALGRLIVKTHRYAERRARRAEDQAWGARVAEHLRAALDAVTDALAVPMTDTHEAEKRIAYKSGGPRDRSPVALPEDAR